MPPVTPLIKPIPSAVAHIQPHSPSTALTLRTDRPPVTDDLSDFTPDADDDGFDLVYPFVVCESQGGPYADEPFAAGFAAGRLDLCLETAARVGATQVRYLLRTDLIPQAELMAMNYGYPTMDVTTSEQHPEWSQVVFAGS